MKILVSLAAFLLVVPISGWSLNVVIKNRNTNYPDSQVYFSFKDAPVAGTINGQSLVRDQAYAVSDIGSGITLQSFASGRIYFSIGAPLTGTGDPEPINSSVANWGTRFDKLELTYGNNPYGVANLTAIDYFAIPLALKTYSGNTATGTPLGTLTYRQLGNTVAAQLGALTNNNPKVVLHDKQGNFLRVLGPTLSPSGVYPSFQPYLAAVQAAGQATQIQGLYSRAGSTAATQTQTYRFTATFDASGNLQLAGGGLPYASNPSVGPGHVVLIQSKDLALGIYSANPGYTVDGAKANIGDNDVYSAVVRDVLTGYALGFVNSVVVDPKTNVAFKDEISDKWWVSPQAYAYLQSNPAYYDQYAAYLQTISDAYGYPFSDRWQTVQVSLNPANVGTMEIDVLPDVAVAVPAVTSATGATAQVGGAFSYQITASNSPTGYTASGLPAGLSVNPATGLISGSPATSGVFSVSLSAANAGGAGSKVTLTLTITEGFSAWQTANFTAAEQQNAAVSGPLGDATGARVANLVKYALGIPPKRPGTAGLPAVSVGGTGGTSYLFLTYKGNSLANGASVSVQVSGDLQTWNSGGAYTTEVSRVSNADGTQTVVTRSNLPISGGTRQCLRLSVSLAGNS